jgi:hypothetical protein
MTSPARNHPLLDKDVARQPVWPRLLPAVAAMLGLLLARPAAADALDGTLEVQSAFVSHADGIYQLNAHVRYPVNENIRAALRDGVSLSFDLDAVVSRERRFWFNAEIASVTLRRELIWQALTERFVVRDAAGREQQSFASLEAALESLGRVEAWPIMVDSQIRDPAEFRVSVRAGMRRGRLTDTLRVVLFWTNDWHRESEWYSWSLPR